MNYQARTSRRATQVVRSQLALRLGLALYAAASTLLAVRLLVLALNFPDSVWTVKTLLSISAPLVLPLTLLPVGQRVLLGSATLADVTAALILCALPLPMLSGRLRGPS
jgi:hypothetical protein